MPRLPGPAEVQPVRQPVAPTPRVPRVDVGGGMERAGSDLMQVGSFLAKAAAREQARTDAIENVRGVTNYQGQIDQGWMNVKETGDLTNPNTLHEYGKYLSDSEQHALDSYSGSPDSKAIFAARLTALKNDAIIKASAAATEAQNKMVDRHVQSVAAEYGDVAENQPARTEELWHSADGILNDLAPATTPEKRAEYQRVLRSSIILSAGQGLLKRGDIGHARQLLDIPGAVEALGPDNERKFNAQILTAQLAHNKGRIEGQQKLDEFHTIMGREPTPQERLRLAGVPQRRGPETLSGKIADLEYVLGRKLTEPEIEKVGNISGADSGSFGTSYRGRLTDIVSTDTPAFQSHLLPPEEERRYLMAVAEMNQPVTYTDPNTGYVMTRHPVLPAYVANAFKMRGVEIPSSHVTSDVLPGAGGSPQPEPSASAALSRSGQPAPAPTPVPQPAEAPPAPAAKPSEAVPPETKASVAGSPPTVQPEAAPSPTESIANMPTNLYDQNEAGYVTGPGPAVAPFLGRTPLIGQYLPQDKMTTARTELANRLNLFMTALRSNRYMPHAQIEDIKNALKLDTSEFDNAHNFRDRIFAADNALAAHEEMERAIAESPGAGAQRRQGATAAIEAIQSFRRYLGAERYATRDEAAQAVKSGDLKPGDYFFLNGQRMRVRGNAAGR